MDNSWISFEICDEYVSCKVYEISDQRIKEIIRDNGYIKFQNPTNKKYITDYPVLLERAGKLGTIAQDKIDTIRKPFAME